MKMWRKIFTTAALTFMLCLTGLVMSGQAQNQTPGGTPVNWRFVDNGNGTVMDKQTQLMWVKNTDQFSLRPATVFDKDIRMQGMS